MSKKYRLSLVRQLSKLLLAAKVRCAVAESCTGGELAAILTELPGSSSWFECGFITYSNQAKTQMLNVPTALIEQFGAVSEPVITAMVEGALSHSNASHSVAISGIAGPGGGSAEKPIGLVWIAWSHLSKPTIAEAFHFRGTRKAIREQAVTKALEGLVTYINASKL